MGPAPGRERLAHTGPGVGGRQASRLWGSGPTGKPGGGRAMPARWALPCWIGACRCHSHGLTTRPVLSAAPHGGADVHDQTQPALGWERMRQVVDEQQVRARWGACDEAWARYDVARPRGGAGACGRVRKSRMRRGYGSHRPLPACRRGRGRQPHRGACVRGNTRQRPARVWPHGCPQLSGSAG